MYEVGQRVRIRERVWVALEDRAESMSGDHTLRVRGVDTQPGGIERTFIYRPTAGLRARLWARRRTAHSNAPPRWLARRLLRQTDARQRFAIFTVLAHDQGQSEHTY